MTRTCSLGIATMVFLAALMAPAAAEACDDACCDYPASSFRVVGHVRGGFVVTATIPSCGYPEQPHPLPQWADERYVRRISSQSYVMVLGAQRRPYAYAEPLAAVEAYSPDELLYWWSRPRKHGALLQGTEKTPGKLAQSTPRTEKGRLAEVLRSDSGDVLYILQGQEPGCASMMSETLLGAYTTPAHDYVLVVSHRSQGANDPYSQDQLTLVAKPDRLDLVVVDAITSDGKQARALLDAALPRLQKAGLRSVKVKKATGKHLETKLFVRPAETDYPTGLFEADGGPGAPVSMGYYWPGVRAMMNALLGQPRGAIHEPRINVSDLDWDEPADLVLVVADDLGAVLDDVRKQIKDCAVE